jgi:hypothetical protein
MKLFVSFMSVLIKVKMSDSDEDPEITIFCSRWIEVVQIAHIWH